MRTPSVFGFPLLVALGIGSLVPPAASARILTVGPGGTHATIQSAIEAIFVADAGPHHIRVARGVWREHVEIWEPFGARTVEITGGWDPTFRKRSFDPAETIIDADGGHTALLVQTNNGRLTVSGFTFTGARSAPVGLWPSGVTLDLAGKAFVDFSGNRIVGNRQTAIVGGFDRGAGLLALLRDAAELQFNRNEVSDNIATSIDDWDFDGGGAYVQVAQNSRVTLIGNRFAANAVFSTFGDGDSALGLWASDHAEAFLSDNRFEDNSLESTYGCATVALRAGHLKEDEARIEARRSTFLRNLGCAEMGQLHLSTRGSSTLIVSDSLVAASPTGGVSAEANSGHVTVNNLTLADLGRAAFSARTFGAGRVFLGNSLFWDNADDIDSSGDVSLSTNLTGVDPLFFDATGADYRLAHGSPAIDRGNNFPTDGLGPLDLEGAPRLQGTHVDIGAYETSDDSTDPDSGCRVLDPSGTYPGHLDLPVFRWTNVCHCLSDPGTVETRCAFRLPEIELVLRFPRFFAPDRTLPLRWAIHPWAEVGGPYSLSALAEIDGQWQPQIWLGPTEDRLKIDRVAIEPFELKPSASRTTPVRTTLNYLRNDGTWAKSTVEFLLPAPTAVPK